MTLGFLLCFEAAGAAGPESDFDFDFGFDLANIEEMLWDCGVVLAAFSDVCLGAAAVAFGSAFNAGRDRPGAGLPETGARARGRSDLALANSMTLYLRRSFVLRPDPS
eukprot:SAG11_NODE_1767_length_4282_cov_3.760220_2_plen_108_part_00